MLPEQFRILCVEDDEDTRQLLTILLSFSDFEAVAVRTAGEGSG